MLKRARDKQGGDAADAPRARALRILVVENHPDTRQGIKAFLKALGHRAAFAEDKGGALALAQRIRFDLLLSDISLPDGNGWELLPALDAQGCRPAHAIAMSGLGEPADQTRSLAAGFELHLVKPFRPEELENALRRVSTAPARIETIFQPPAPARAATKAELRKRMHDGLAQHLVAATLLQGALTNNLENLATGSADHPAVRIADTVADAKQISRLLDEALAETLSLMRAV